MSTTNKDKIAQIDAKIAELQKEKERLVEEDKIPETKRKINEYLTKTYSGKKLAQTHKLDEKGFWEVLGEDENCDLAGPHHQPHLGIIEGTLEAALKFAVQHKRFSTWGGGGDIRKVSVIKG